jgi:molybdopterin/thiamine biosynthesis adenylyltransferase
LANGRFVHGAFVDPLSVWARQVSHTLSNARLQADPINAVQEDGSGDDSPVQGLLDLEWMVQRTVLLFGAGAVGGRNSILLAPYGLTQIVVDHDSVEHRNTIADRTLYTTGDVGRLKVVVLRDKITAAHTETRVVIHPRNVHHISATELHSLARQSDAAIVAIDEGPAMVHLNEVLYPELTVFYQGVHEQGKSGQIIITRPGTPCLKCCMNIQDGQEIETLHREPALGVHAAAVAQMTVQLLVQELAARNGSELGAPLEPSVSILFLSHMASPLTPHGPGTVPFAVERNPACEVCGNNEDERS